MKSQWIIWLRRECHRPLHIQQPSAISAPGPSPPLASYTAPLSTFPTIRPAQFWPFLAPPSTSQHTSLATYPTPWFPMPAAILHPQYAEAHISSPLFHPCSP